MGEVIQFAYVMPKDDQKQQLMLQPAVVGLSEGDASFTAIGEENNLVTLNYHWEIESNR